MSPKNAPDPIQTVTYRQVAQAFGKNHAIAKQVRADVDRLLDERISFGLPAEENVATIRAFRELATLDDSSDSDVIRARCAQARSSLGQSSITSFNHGHALDMIGLVERFPADDSRAEKAKKFLESAHIKGMDKIEFLERLRFALEHMRGAHQVSEDVVPCGEIESWIEKHIADVDMELGLQLLRYLKIVRKNLGIEGGSENPGKKAGKSKPAPERHGFVMDPHDDELPQTRRGGSRRAREEEDAY